MMTRRRGITLMEILIAILVMGIGLISLATLFPIGILSVREANLNTRASLLARSAQEMILLTDMLRSPTIIDPSNDGNDIAAGTDVDNKYSRGKRTDDAYPVVIDPLGYLEHLKLATGLQTSFGGLERVDLGLATVTTNRDLVEEFFRSPDDLVHLQKDDRLLGVIIEDTNANGALDVGEDTNENGVLDSPYQARAGNFSWLVTAQPIGLRPSLDQETDPQRNLDLRGWHIRANVVVFNRRRVDGDAETNYGFRVTDPDPTVDDRRVVITWPDTTPPPAVRLGGYVVDATVDDAETPPIRHCEWYRIEGIQPAVSGAGTNSQVLLVHRRPLVLKQGDPMKTGVALVPPGVVNVFPFTFDVR